MSIRSLLAERVPSAPASDALADRISYSHDSWQRGLIELSEGQAPRAEQLPGAVVWPTNARDVAELVELSRSEGLKLVPFGAGSGVCAGVAADERTLVVDLKRLDAWRVNPSAPLVSVGPGAMGISLETQLEQQGFTIGHFPSSILCSTIGGWVAARGAGQCSSRFGKIEDMLVSAQCVLGNGRIVRFRRRAAGLDLSPLIVGSEGALGIITDVELRLTRTAAPRQFSAFRFASGARGMEALRR
ncbi:MAG TPA: FAD-binding oxidoreductase, partial [Polyangiaceae bacterium]|nr:FAD-binding oxidoreductase [Polyangiaceae bacterium]